jgi:hypothetical protein
LIGLGPWLVRADWVLFPMLTTSLGLIAWGLYRRQTNAACYEVGKHEEGLKP